MLGSCLRASLLVVMLGLLAFVIFEPGAAPARAGSGDISDKAVLESGRSGKWAWTMNVSADDLKVSRLSHRPCIEVSLTPLGPVSPIDSIPYARTCGPLSPVPMIIGLTEASKTPWITVIAIAFPARVSLVRLYINGRRSRLVELSLLSRHKSLKTRTAPFRYGALAFRGRFCLERFLGYSPSGRVLFDGGHMSCPRTFEPSFALTPLH